MVLTMNDLIKIISDYKPSLEETLFKGDILNLINNHGKACLYRDLFTPGHITGSALLVSEDRKRVLMNHHKKLNKWICFGGHADGEEDILNVAKREVQEESGIDNITAPLDDVLDIDIHKIPETLKEPSHRHFDIRCVFAVADKKYEKFKISDESKELKWCNYREACTLIDSNDVGMLRLLTKWYESSTQNKVSAA